jgi:hypothetical protein
MMWNGVERLHWRSALVALSCLFSLALPVNVWAQQEAGIIGQVTDESGGVLPGVTVSVTGPALQVPSVVSVTDERGEYRVSPLPIGAYTAVYTLAGFQAIRREGLRLTVGFTAKVDVQMKLGALEESIVVSGGSPVIDVAATAARTQLTRETLELIPTSRSSIQSMLVQVPGVRSNLDVGGSSQTGTPQFRAFGQEFESWQMVDGIVTVSPKGSAQGGVFWDYNALEEVQVETLGKGAEFPTRGIGISSIVKSGGNMPHGGFSWNQTYPGLEGNNIDSALKAQGVSGGNPLAVRWDVMGDLGGRIVKDKLWFYIALRSRKNGVGVVNLFNPDGSQVNSYTRQKFTTEKVSYQANASNKFIVLHQFNPRLYDSGLSEFNDLDNASLIDSKNRQYKVEWQRMKGNFFSSLQMAQFNTDAIWTGKSTKPATTDLITRRNTGLSTSVGQVTLERRQQYRGSFTWYRPDAFAGNHQLGAGFDYHRVRGDRPYNDRGVAGNYQLVFNNGAPFAYRAFNFPVSAFTYTRYLGIYVKDSWTIGRQLTLNLGVRYAHDNGFLPAQCAASTSSNAGSCYPLIQFPISNTVAPRLHFAYDVTGNGHTVIKGGWGRFVHMRQTDELSLANANVGQQTEYRWTDPNGNRDYDPGEVNLDVNGGAFVSKTNLGGALSGGVPNPNEKTPYTDEFTVSLEQQLVAGWAARVSGIYTANSNTYRLLNNRRPPSVFNIPITNTDPGPDNIRGNADDPGRSITYYDYSSAYGGLAFQEPTLANDPNADAHFTSIEFATSRQLTSRWQLMASYSATKSDVPFLNNLTNSTFLNANEWNPNTEINNSNRTWEWIGRVSAAYVFPMDFVASMNYEHRSGEPWGRTAVFTGGSQVRSLTLRVEPVGTRRLPNVNLVDLRLQKTLHINGTHSLIGRLNLYNALNANPVLALNQQSGTTFGRPSSILPPRILELSASYTF